MINNTTNTATGEPVTEQAPAVDTTSTTQATPAAPGLPRRLSFRGLLCHHRQGGQVSSP